MADEMLEETQTEGTTETTPETTPSEGTTEGTQTEGTTEGTQTEGTTEGTQTEGTTGNGYLTKPYLVRNLQTFWDKIKQYITNQEFVNESYVDNDLLSDITSYATDEGHIVLNFPNSLTHFKIYTPNSDRPIEKISLRNNNNEVLFTTFQEENDSWAVTIENPEGKIETEDKSDNLKTTWKITPGESFNFYVEDFVLDNSKYKSFILEAKRGGMNDNNILLNIVEIFES